MIFFDFSGLMGCLLHLWSFLRGCFAFFYSLSHLDLAIMFVVFLVFITVISVDDERRRLVELYRGSGFLNCSNLSGKGVRF